MLEEFSCIDCPVVADGTPAVLLQDANRLPELAKHLQGQKQYQTLLMINAVEYKEHLQVIYQLLSVEPEYKMLFLRVNLPTDQRQIPSLAGVWQSADWFEREIWDMHGLVFTGHPDLRRILNPDDWVGFPLRKDYIPPLDALNGPISAVKENMQSLDKSVRADVERIIEA